MRFRLAAALALVLVGSSCAAQSSAAPTVRSSSSTPSSKSSHESVAPRSTASGQASGPQPVSSNAEQATKLPNAAALQRLKALVAQRSAGWTSVSATDLSTGTTVSVGASSGMTLASVAKLQLIEALLVSRQRRHRHLDAYERSIVTRMIEHSDNAAADQVFAAIGGQGAVYALVPTLGLSHSTTHVGAGGLWGLGTSSAAQQIVLLDNLVLHRSPLWTSNKLYVRYLMHHVESDQRWGVPVVADRGTSPAVKNGWLGVADDGYRWAVNSVGLAYVRGHRLAIAVMTQHGGGFGSGITRVEQLVRAAAAAARG